MKISLMSEKLRHGEDELPLRTEPFEFEPPLGHFLIVPELEIGQKDCAWDRIGFDLQFDGLPEDFSVVVDAEDQSVKWQAQMEDISVTVNPFWDEDRIYIAVRPLEDGNHFGEGCYALLAIECKYEIDGENILRIRIVPIENE